MSFFGFWGDGRKKRLHWSQTGGGAPPGAHSRCTAPTMPFERGRRLRRLLSCKRTRTTIKRHLLPWGRLHEEDSMRKTWMGKARTMMPPRPHLRRWPRGRRVLQRRLQQRRRTVVAQVLPRDRGEGQPQHGRHALGKWSTSTTKTCMHACENKATSRRGFWCAITFRLSYDRRGTVCVDGADFAVPNLLSRSASASPSGRVAFCLSGGVFHRGHQGPPCHSTPELTGPAVRKGGPGCPPVNRRWETATPAMARLLPNKTF